MKKIVTDDQLKEWRRTWSEGSREKLTEIWEQYPGQKGEPEAYARLSLAYCIVNGFPPENVFIESIPGRFRNVAEMVAIGNGHMKKAKTYTRKEVLA